MSAAGANKGKASKNQEWEYEGSNSDARERPISTSPVARVSQPPRSRVSASSPLPVPHSPILDPYRAVVVGGHIAWSPQWIQRLTDYVKSGGTVVLNSAQINGIPADLLGLRLMGVTAEADNARCLSPGEAAQNLSGQMFRYEKVELKWAKSLIISDTGDPLVTVSRLGKGTVVFSAVPDLLGEDERITPFLAHMLAHVFADATPIRVKGDVEYLVNRKDNGWVVTLFNNNGVFKPQQGLAQVDRGANVTATISLDGQQIQKALDWMAEKDVEVKHQNGANSVTVTIAPGGVSIIELRSRK
jgi:hypothetical protein